MKIPLSKIYIDQEIKDSVIKVLDGGKYILGDAVKEFESKFANFCRVKHAVCASSGTAAAFLTLKSLKISHGDEVICPSFSFIATASPILQVGAKPVFAEISPKNYTIDPADVKRKISKKTKAIIPVHLYGQPADMDPLLELAEKYSLPLIEDACQAHGAEYESKRVGGIGTSGFFSFYPSKNMTVCGDGGMVTTNDDSLAQSIRLLRDHGRREKYSHEMLGYNMRFNEIQAAIGIKQLEKLPSWNESRREIAKVYNSALDSSLVKPIEETWAKHVYHMYVIRVGKRNELQKFLEQAGISTGIHYPIPIHKQPAISNLVGSISGLEITETAADSVLSLPMFPQLKVEQVRYVSETVNNYLKRN